MSIPESHQTTAIETIQTVVIGVTLILDHKTILTIDHIIIIVNKIPS